MTSDKNIKDILHKYAHDLYTKDDAEFLIDYLLKGRPFPELSQEMDDVWDSLELIEAPADKQKEYLDEAKNYYIH